jgi:hypothetical protein
MRKWITILFVGATLASPVFAHKANTSYTRIHITDDHIDFVFVFDIATLLKLHTLDANNDKLVSRDEVIQAGPDVHAFLADHVRVFLDGRESSVGELHLTNWLAEDDAVDARYIHPTMVEFHTRRPIISVPEKFSLAYSLTEKLGDGHLNLVRIEGDRVEPVEFVLRKNEPEAEHLTGLKPDLGRIMRRYFILGVEHIFLGYDHILFLLALLVMARFMDMVKVVTSFTVAHSVTLSLAALSVVTLPGRFIEIAIAGTIMYVAVENLWIKSTGHRWALTFAFGLVHGFGFANVLGELGLPAKGLARSLFMFNLGVEAGQLAIVLVMFPVIYWIGLQSYAARARVSASLAIFCFGLVWLIERVFAITILPV